MLLMFIKWRAIRPEMGWESREEGNDFYDLWRQHLTVLCVFGTENGLTSSPPFASTGIGAHASIASTREPAALLASILSATFPPLVRLSAHSAALCITGRAVVYYRASHFYFYKLTLNSNPEDVSKLASFTTQDGERNEILAEEEEDKLFYALMRCVL
jgi:hypothetical protein